MERDGISLGRGEKVMPEIRDTKNCNTETPRNTLKNTRCVKWLKFPGMTVLSGVFSGLADYGYVENASLTERIDKYENATTACPDESGNYME